MVKQISNRYWITPMLDDYGHVLTYFVIEHHPYRELGEFNTLKEARDFIRSKEND